jgi:SAM-dependent methyltransferase
MPTDQILYNTIGVGYNNTRRADPFIAKKLFDHLSPQQGSAYLDIGCGTGNYTIALAEKGINFYGVEPSESMLALAREKNKTVMWRLGTAENIPATDAFFDGAIATLTVHHWVDLNGGMAEIQRVLKPGGRLVVFTSTPVQMQGYWLNHYFPDMLAKSIGQMPSLERIREALRAAGLHLLDTEKYFIPDDLQDCFLYVGKNRPELYLVEEIRKGISSFVALANKEEVEEGLTRLQADLAAGAFTAIRDKFSNDLGDYLFIIAQK